MFTVILNLTYLTYHLFYPTAVAAQTCGSNIKPLKLALLKLHESQGHRMDYQPVLDSTEYTQPRAILASEFVCSNPSLTCDLTI
jgi:hypothetical protein